MNADQIIAGLVRWKDASAPDWPRTLVWYGRSAWTLLRLRRTIVSSAHWQRASFDTEEWFGPSFGFIKWSRWSLQFLWQPDLRLTDAVMADDGSGPCDGWERLARRRKAPAPSIKLRPTAEQAAVRTNNPIRR